MHIASMFVYVFMQLWYAYLVCITDIIYIIDFLDYVCYIQIFSRMCCHWFLPKISDGMVSYQSKQLADLTSRSVLYILQLLSNQSRHRMCVMLLDFCLQTWQIWIDNGIMWNSSQPHILHLYIFWICMFFKTKSHYCYIDIVNTGICGYILTVCGS